MNINQINEAFDLYTEDGLKFADFDVEGLYDTIKPESFGSISFDEIKEVKDFLGLTGEETEDELRGIRNSIVKYWSDNLDEEREKAEKEWKELKAKNPNADFHEFRKHSNYDIQADQMSAFTHVIDMELHTRFGHL